MTSRATAITENDIDDAAARCAGLALASTNWKAWPEFATERAIVKPGHALPHLLLMSSDVTLAREGPRCRVGLATIELRDEPAFISALAPVVAGRVYQPPRLRSVQQ